MSKLTEPLSEKERRPYEEKIENFLKENNIKDHLIIFTTNKQNENDTNKIFLDFESSSKGFEFISNAFTKILLNKNEEDKYLYEIFFNFMSKELLEKISEDYKNEFLIEGDIYDKLEKMMGNLIDNDFIRSVKF